MPTRTAAKPKPAIRFALLACVCLVDASAAPRNSPLVAVTSVRHWSSGNVTRIAVELSSKVTYRWEKITGPDRIFVDLKESRMALGSRGIHRVPVGDALVRQVRVATTEPGTTRVVLDLTNGNVGYEVSLLSNPVRLIIEVRPGGPVGETTVSGNRSRQPETPAGAGQAAGAAAANPPKADVVIYTPPPPAQAASAAASALPSAALPRPDPEPRETAGAAAGVAPATPKAAENLPPPKPAKPTTSDGRASLTRALGLKLGRIVIDPGHGGHDHGTTGPTGLIEKELVLDIAMRLGAMVEQRLGSEVVYTRTTDVFLPLEERTAIANGRRADLFISIHANSSPLRSASGAEVFYLNFTTSRESMAVAARENASHGKSIFELRELLQKIALKEKIDESRDFASKVQNSLHVTWARMNGRKKNRGVKQAPFVVLIGASMPSILAEVGFVSNPRDESLLKKPDQRQRIAEALFRGIQQYASSLSQMAVSKTAVAGEN